MPTMDELLAQAGISGADADTLHRLVGDWQLLADLSFADLLLTIPVGDDRFAVAAQMRPTTGPTVYQDDLVGTTITAARRPQLAVSTAEGRICREGDPVWSEDAPIRQESVPVRSGSRIIAVVARDTNLAAARTPSRLEITYLRSANDLAQMLADGSWPYPGEPGADGHSGPRVGDGLIRLDADGIVEYASPNALSAYRRLGYLGDLVGSSLADVTRGISRGAAHADEPLLRVAEGRSPRDADVEAADAVVELRSLPLRPGGQHIGALVLVHDVTELRRRERALLTKDATIREIHHRVKNNLQTVAALLRLQARRTSVPQARAALDASVRRVASIAVVHETLSGTLEQSVPFDDVADRVLALLADVGGSALAVRRSGSFGVLSGEAATPLAMVLTELVQNAVEHGYGGGDGAVEVIVDRPADAGLRVRVVDHGRGVPPGFDVERSDRLGLQIARALIEGEMGGRLTLQARPDGGTEAVVDLAEPRG
ncbi:MAG TPA: histidine kinase N-terminal domain-containing protein [Mycobacteriales bacterium]|nr:histidine kinase N-terminal domain-containing protein [Mycobacteriales bacterium]